MKHYKRMLYLLLFYIISLASVLGLLSVLMLFVEKDISTGIAGLLMAFAISPFGLPALAGWLLAKLDELNGSLRGFIMG